MTNLLSNAVKYSPAKTTISLSLAANKKSVTIAIADQGKGVPIEVQNKLFDPFFQSSQENNGLGLGLYIAKSLVALHDGEIWLESVPKKGTIFFIRLPRSN